MADVIKRKTKDYILNGIVELEVDEEVREFNVSISKADFFKLHDAINNMIFEDFKAYFIYDFLRLNSEEIYQIDDDEIINCVENISEIAEEKLKRLPSKRPLQR